MELKLIKQVDDTGCGIACVAMLKKQSYEEVRDELKALKEWGPRKRNLRTFATDLKPLFKDFGHVPDEVRFDSFEGIKGAAIVGVELETEGQSGGNKFHWVVAFKTDGLVWIADPDYGELYRYDNWNEDNSDGFKYRLADFESLAFPTLEITSIALR